MKRRFRLVERLEFRRRVDTDYEELRERLFAAECPYKLYEARLLALEIVTGETLVPRIATVITERIPAAGADAGWAAQFERDLRTYGLLEAILYFHTYPPLAEGFVNDACELYERFARLYLRHREQIRTSVDSRVLVQLHFLRRLGDSKEHACQRPLAPPRRPAGEIAPPRQPELKAGYERQLPVHPDLLDVIKWMAGKKVAPGYGCFADELAETITAQFTFDGFPGVQSAFFEIAEVLDEHCIDVFGSEGQYILKALFDHLQIEGFGDFEHWIPCAACAEEFFVEVTPETINASLIAGGWMCERCRGAEGSGVKNDGG